MVKAQHNSAQPKMTGPAERRVCITSYLSCDNYDEQMIDEQFTSNVSRWGAEMNVQQHFCQQWKQSIMCRNTSKNWMMMIT